MLGTIASLAGSLFGGLFGMQREKTKLYKAATGAVGDVLSSGISAVEKMEVAKMALLTAELKSDGFLTRNWRPIAILALLGVIVAQAFGYANIQEVYFNHLIDLSMVLMGANVIGRSLEKIFASTKVLGLLKGVVVGFFGKNALKGMN